MRGKGCQRPARAGINVKPETLNEVIILLSIGADSVGASGLEYPRGKLCRSITRNSSGDEIANVNFLYDDVVHVLQNTIDSCINSAIDRAVMCWNACLPNLVR